ncbi:MAG: sigma factor [Polyangiaceae bacterium]
MAGNARTKSPPISGEAPSVPDADQVPLYGLLEAWWSVPESDEASERKFIERLRAHDERAFNGSVELYKNRVFALVFRMLGRRDEAEDMTHTVFVQVFKAIGQFRGDLEAQHPDLSHRGEPV